MEDTDTFLVKFKGYYFGVYEFDVGFIEHLNDFEIRDDDVCIITYPKSGTVWFQQILCLTYFEEYRKSTGNLTTAILIPFVEYDPQKMDFVARLSPHIFTTHLSYYLVPRGLKNKKAKIIYIYRNPKDVMCSYFHFSKNVRLSVTTTFEEFMKRFLEGEVVGSLWFDHIKGSQRFCVRCVQIFGKELSEEDMDIIVSQTTFENMKNDPRANYDNILKVKFGVQEKGHFLHKDDVEQ